jgi:hypothetical protein
LPDSIERLIEKPLRKIKMGAADEKINLSIKGQFLNGYKYDHELAATIIKIAIPRKKSIDPILLFNLNRYLKLM